MIDFKRLAGDLLARASELVPAWLPEGKRSGHEWVCGDLKGNAGSSTSINLDTGMWSDFAADEAGGDLISLYAAIHGLSQLDAAKELGRGDYDTPAGADVPHGTPTPEPQESSQADPLLPAPTDAPGPPEPRRGTVEAVHRYTLPDGSLVGVIQRIQTDEGKTFRQWRWSPDGWTPKSMPEPRPLYGLTQLADRPKDAVLIVEGEKTADAARAALPRYVVVTWPGGAKAWKKANWRILADRKLVHIWPDADVPGREAAAGIAVELFRAGVAEIAVVDPQLTIEGQENPEIPEGWDIADAVAAGWSTTDIINFARPRMRKIEKPPVDRGVKKAPPELPARGLIQGTDMALARRLHARHGANIRYVIERAWLVWSGERWQIDDKGIMIAALAKDSAESLLDEIRDAPDRNEAFKAAKGALQKRAVDASIWLARSEAGVPARLIDFDQNHMILNVQNGTVDLTTGKLREHDRADMCTMIAGTEYDSRAQCTRWRQFIGEICREDVALMDYLQKWGGYLLTGSVVEHAIAFLWGGGRNGKSRFVETLLALLGDYACVASTDLVMVRRHQGIPNDVARLRGVRAVFMNETNKGQRFDESKLKDLSGGDKQNARFMREEFFDFLPTHKLVMRGNSKPGVTGTDEGIWSRFRLIPFLADFSGNPDTSLDAKLLAELPGILNWCIEGCLAWQRDKLASPPIVESAVSRYRAQSDTLGRFIETTCTKRAEGAVSLAKIYGRYKDYCQLAGERWVSLRDFPDDMALRGFTEGNDAAGVRIIKGLEMAARSEWERSRPDSDFDMPASGWEF